MGFFGAGDVDDARLVQQTRLYATGIRGSADKQYAAMLPFANQIAEQRIIGTRETQIDHLSVRIKRGRESGSQCERIAACGVGVGMRLPTGLEYEEPCVRRDPDDSLAIVGDGG